VNLYKVSYPQNGHYEWDVTVQMNASFPPGEGINCGTQMKIVAPRDKTAEIQEVRRCKANGGAAAVGPGDAGERYFMCKSCVMSA